MPLGQANAKPAQPAQAVDPFANPALANAMRHGKKFQGLLGGGATAPGKKLNSTERIRQQQEARKQQGGVASAGGTPGTVVDTYPGPGVSGTGAGPETAPVGARPMRPAQKLREGRGGIMYGRS